MKIAILGAMAEEITPLLEKLDHYETINYANNRYYCGNYHGHELVIAHSKIGKVFASLTTMVMIEHFGVDLVLFSGVAGGVADEVKVGDLVVAVDTAQHDVDITAFGYEHGFIPLSKTKVTTCPNLLSVAKEAAQHLNIEIKSGTIATGDQFIHDVVKKEFIKTTFNAVALEMEGGSVNLICHEMGIPCLILRAISDTADGGACDDFPAFVEMAANRSAVFIFAVIDLL
ncbi:MAG: 5'-methylthioadenosine/adenosylhomocysteine nucleosidase [Francisellaceae bacterium]